MAAQEEFERKIAPRVDERVDPSPLLFDVGRETPGQAVDSSAIMSAPGCRAGASSFRRFSMAIAAAFGSCPLSRIELIILLTLASSRSTSGLVPSGGPFISPSPRPDEDSAVPTELVPGLAALVPKAPPVIERNPPPVIDICDPMPPRANAALAERPMPAMTSKAANLFIVTSFVAGALSTLISCIRSFRAKSRQSWNRRSR